MICKPNFVVTVHGVVCGHCNALQLFDNARGVIHENACHMPGCCVDAR